jgi:uncharacterized protein
MEVPRYWRQRKQRYSMVGEICPDCKSHVFPPRDVCPYCSETNRQSVTVTQQGAVLAFAQPVTAGKP